MSAFILTLEAIIVLRFHFIKSHLEILHIKFAYLKQAYMLLYVPI
jgi:hypothetical protein